MTLRNTTPAWLTALTLLAGCATEGSDSPQPDAPDFRDGAYHYVLGYSPVDQEQIRGGSHAVVGFNEEGKTEAIDDANRLSRFHPDVLTNSDYYLYDSSLSEGHTSWDVFASTWWPQAKNGTSWRWQPGAGQDYNDHTDTSMLSPTEKYDLMFYPGQESVVEAVSHCSYPDYAEDPDNCEEIEHPELRVTGPVTKWELENQGQYQWVEPDSWWGHCNGWASYATTEELGYPRRDINVRIEDGQVTECTDGDTDGCLLWRMADMEALMTELYFSDQATFTGRRCNTRPDEIERDEYGRPTEVACRDLNPGSFHVAITGMLGRGARNLGTGQADAKPAFIIDHNWDHEIWNFPIVSYEVNGQEEITSEQANEMIGAAGSDYVFNEDAARFVQVKLTYAMISDGVPAPELLVRADLRDMDPVEVELNYVLELDADDRILGGEWIEDPTVSWGEDSKELHPDFIWMAVDHRGYGEGADDLGGDSDNPFMAYSDARALLQCANEPESCAPQGGGGTNPGGGLVLSETGSVAQGEADRHSLDLEAGTYTVTLSHDPTNPIGDADLYVRVGAEPTAAAYDCRPYAGGSDEECVVELDAAATVFIMVDGYGAQNPYRLTVVGEDDDGGNPGAWSGLEEAGNVARNQETRFETPVLPAGTYEFTMTGNNDADLYVRVGDAPTTAAYDCRPYTSGTNETCAVSLATAEAVHVMVRGYAASSDYELVGERN